MSDLRELYWLKEELQAFCREHGLSTAGGKRDIAARIEEFLRTGRRVTAPRPTVEATEARSVNAARAEDFSMTTRAPAGFRCTQEARRFFEQHLGPRFRFTVTLQTFIKEHPGVTFAEIADEWRRQDELRRRGELRPSIGPQFELNRFTRDFFADPRNAGKTREDCLEAWKRARARRGDHGYRPEEP